LLFNSERLIKLNNAKDLLPLFFTENNLKRI